MSVDAALGVLNNVAFLLALGVLYQFFPVHSSSSTTSFKALSGLVLGFWCALLMLAPYELLPGLFFDTRSILLSLTGLFFGGLATVIAVAVAVTTRVLQGGVGALPGVLVIVSSGLIGVIWRRWRGTERGSSTTDLLLIGVVVHVVMLACMLTLPHDTAMATIGALWLPVMLVYPLTTLIFGRLLALQRQRRLTQDDIQRRERRHRRVLENAWSVLALLDATGKIREISESATRILGQSREHYIDTSLLDHLPPEEHGPIESLLVDILQRPGGTVHIEHRLQHATDGWRWFESKAVNLLDHPDVGAIICSSRDITERREHLAKLEESRQKLAEAQRIAKLGRWEYDIANDVLTWSDSIYEMFGVDPDRTPLSVDDFYAYVHPDDLQQVKDLYAQSLESRQPTSFTHRVLHPDGRVTWAMEMCTTTYDEHGGPVRSTGVVQDITERKTAELTYGAMLRSSMESIAIIDDEGTILEANDAMLRRYGFTRRELLGKHVTTFTTDSHAVVMDRIARLAETGGERFETKHRRKNGDLLDVEVSVVYLTVDSPRLFIFARDITNRKRAEEELRQNERNLLEAQQIANIGHYVFNVASGSWTCSPMLDSIFGIERDHPKTVESWLELIHEEDREEMQAYLMEEVIGKQRRFDRQYRVKTADTGQTRWVHGYGEVRVDEDGNSIEMIGSIQDITETKITELELAAERNLLKLIMHTSPVGVITLDRTGSFTYLNPVSERILGVTREEAGSITINRIVGRLSDMEGELLEQDKLPFFQIMKHGKTLTNQQVMLTNFKDEQVAIAVNAGPLRDKDGQLTGVVAILDDITSRLATSREKAKVEAQLVQAQKMEAIGRLAGGVAHDFNNMLTVISNIAEMALARVEDDNPLRDDLVEVTQTVDRAADLTRQLLAFSRHQRTNPKVVNLNEQVQSNLKMLDRLIGDDIEIETTLAEDLPNVYLDPTQVTQILANLIVNARDAIADTGTIQIQTSTAHLDASQSREDMPVTPGTYVLLDVTDTGCGMDADTVSHIFEPFYTTKAAGEGTGLGLSTVYGIVRQNHGVIHPYSEPGQGTSFKVYFPVHTDEASEASPGESLADLKGDETVLVVEDDSTILKAVERVLNWKGYTVVTAQFAEEALDYVRSDGPLDMVISDLILPKMNGREMMDSILAIRPGVKTLYMSGYAGDTVRQRGLLDESVAFIQKPFTPTALLQQVRDVLDKAVTR